MRLGPLLLMTIAGALLFGTSAAQDRSGACSAVNRIALHHAGYTGQEVELICEQSSRRGAVPEIWGILSGEGQARWVQWCVTRQGTCSLNPALGYYAVGEPCNCYMPWGYSNGVAQ